MASIKDDPCMKFLGGYITYKGSTRDQRENGARA
jgi:hypothetical protein